MMDSFVPRNRRIRDLLDSIIWVDGLAEIARIAILHCAGCPVEADTSWPKVADVVLTTYKDLYRPRSNRDEFRFGFARSFASRHNKWVTARNSLIQKAVTMPFIQDLQAKLPTDDLEADMQRLLYVLLEVSADDPRIFSFALQCFLAYMTINWPDGVFEDDFARPSRGRSFSSLDIHSWVLTSRCGYGWSDAAKNLLPQEYSNSPGAAIAKVREAARRIEAYQRGVEESILSLDQRTRDLLDRIVWVRGLRALFRRVVDRKLRATWPTVLLQATDCHENDGDAAAERAL